MAVENPGMPLSKVITDVLEERRRQIEVEKFTAAHDDLATEGQIAMAAACYALFSTPFKQKKLWVRPIWPWHISWWKSKSPREDLVRAAALLLAEIERLDRADVLSKGPQQP